jgi:hypothetical protein
MPNFTGTAVSRVSGEENAELDRDRIDSGVRLHSSPVRDVMEPDLERVEIL